MNVFSKLRLGAILWVAIALVVLPLGLYFFQFHGELSNNSTVWGDFGSFLGGCIQSGAAFLELVVVLYIATVVRDHDDRSKKMDCAKDMHREWDSFEMSSSRTAARKVANWCRDKGKSFVDLEEIEPTPQTKPEEKELIEQKRHLWMVIGFFERLKIMVEMGSISDELFEKMFGQLFVWWDLGYFHSQPNSWRQKSAFDFLKDRLKARSNSEVGKQMLNEWIQYAHQYHSNDLKMARVRYGLDKQEENKPSNSLTV